MPNYKDPSPPDFTSVLQELKRDVQLSINCHQIGTIVSFDPSTQTASIQISIKQVVSIDPDGTKTIKDYPVLVVCPCFTLQGGADFISMPIIPGDNCLVCFNDRQIDNWLDSGDGQAPTLPRVHDLSDGIALVGLRPLTRSIMGYLANGVRISHAGDTVIDLLDDLLDITATDTVFSGNVKINGNLSIQGDTTGDADNDIELNANLRQGSSFVLEAGNGATGTFGTVTVVKGIVVSGS